MNARRSFFVAGVTGLGAALLPSPAAPPWGAVVTAFSRLLMKLPTLADCRITKVHPVLFGAIPIVLEGPGGAFQVDVCRKADVVRGVAHSRRLDLFVHNGGDGSKATTREQILAVRALAAELEAHEHAGGDVPDLFTWEERQLHASGSALSVIDVDAPSDLRV